MFVSPWTYFVDLCPVYSVIWLKNTSSISIPFTVKEEEEETEEDAVERMKSEISENFENDEALSHHMGQGLNLNFDMVRRHCLLSVAPNVIVRPLRSTKRGYAPASICPSISPFVFALSFKPTDLWTAAPQWVGIHAVASPKFDVMRGIRPGLNDNNLWYKTQVILMLPSLNYNRWYRRL